MLAQNAVVETQGVLAGAAVSPTVAGYPRVDHPRVAGPHRAHIGAHRFHDARSVGTEDVGVVVFVRQPAHDEEIEAVERSRAQRDANVPGLERGRRVRNVRDFEAGGAAGWAGPPGAPRGGAPGPRPDG